MDQQKSIYRISELLTGFVTHVKALNSLNLYDINVTSENVLIPIFKIVFDCPNLINANSAQKNYPGIDLIDETTRQAFQITSTPTIKKIAKTLTQYVKNDFNEKFDNLFIYVLTEKQKKYTSNALDGIIGGRFSFSTDKNILDYTDLLGRINNLSYEKIKAVEVLLEQQYSGTIINRKTFSGTTIQNAQIDNSDSEKYFLNLVEISFPEKIFIAELNVDRKEIIRNAKEGKIKLKRQSSLRDILKGAINLKGIPYCIDWTLHENKLITFKDLGDPNEPLSKLVDRGTVDSVVCNEFYSKDDDYKNIFKGLLGFSLQEKLQQKGVEWHRKSRVFRFKADPVPKTKQIKWKKINEATKTVIFEIWNKEKSHIVCFRHLAFSYSIKNYFDSKWYLCINPTWSFTNNGYNISRFSDVYMAGIKRMENNKAIYYYYRFWAYFISTINLFDSEYQYIKALNPISINFSPTINDSEWKPLKAKLDDDQFPQPLDLDMTINFQSI
jgi:hypothetical protein